jgi:hypothetical protein
VVGCEAPLLTVTGDDPLQTSGVLTLQGESRRINNPVSRYDMSGGFFPTGGPDPMSLGDRGGAGNSLQVYGYMTAWSDRMDLPGSNNSNAFNFDGVDDAQILPGNPAYTTAGGFTLSLWAGGLQIPNETNHFPL